MRAPPILAALLLPATAAAGESFGGAPTYAFVQCAGAEVSLEANEAWTPTPTLNIGVGPGRSVALEDGPNYAGPVCVTWRGRPHVGLVEGMGNAYEAYRLWDVETMATAEIGWEEAEAIGWWDDAP